MNKLRDDLPPLPPRIAALPIDDRGYPVPWFVAWIDGKPEFRVADGRKRVEAMQKSLCWVCGNHVGPHLTFVIGPMCAVNRVTAEPPCHHDCARFSAQACPFLSKPQMVRRENDLPEGTSCDGHPIRRNPGVTCLWRTRGFMPFSDGNGGWLIRLCDPMAVEWWRQGRQATREEVLESIGSGLPLLMDMAKQQGDDAVAELLRMRSDAERWLPAS